MPLLQVISMSGDEVSRFSVEELQHLAEENGGSEIKGVKRHLAAVVGQPRFRLRLLCGSSLVGDDAVLELPEMLHLVITHFRGEELAESRRVAELQKACSTDNAKLVESILSRPQDPDLADARGLTALHVAASEGALQSVVLLLEAGANLEKIMGNGATALHMAAQRGHLEVMRQLLDSGADKDACDVDGGTALFKASRGGHLEVVRLLLSSKADPHKRPSDASSFFHRTYLLHGGIEGSNTAAIRFPGDLPARDAVDVTHFASHIASVICRNKRTDWALDI
ncbi:ASB2 [Symbiodinium natans]|uniref:ASB2 protein n=1 Tax=Symbiodinium natans TaxID=878477 RepID=A0A812NVN3_9DINO|nr:ASB2 [Symbiodinium natans]